MIGGVLDFGGSFLPPRETVSPQVPAEMRLHCRTGSGGTCVHHILSVLTGRPSDEFIPYSRDQFTGRMSRGMCLRRAAEALDHRGFNAEHLRLGTGRYYGPRIDDGGFEGRPTLARVIPWLRSEFAGVRYFILSVRFSSGSGLHAVLLDIERCWLSDVGSMVGVDGESCELHKRRFVQEFVAVSKSC